MANNMAPVVWAGEMVEVGTLEDGGGIGFNIKLHQSGQIITITGLTEAQASIAAQYLYKEVEIQLSGVIKGLRRIL